MKNNLKYTIFLFVSIVGLSNLVIIPSARSEAGKDWVQAKQGDIFSARRLHTSVVFDDVTGPKIWVIGGLDASSVRKNDVWYSSDGVNWNMATSNAGWTPRYGHASVVFRDPADNIDKIWVFGGYDGTSLNDVWCSQDGIAW